jgi:hypothetical protein
MRFTRLERKTTGICAGMTSAPLEPISDPEVFPDSAPDINPVAPGEPEPEPEHEHDVEDFPDVDGAPDRG